MTASSDNHNLCKGLRVLVIDDNEAEAESSAEALERIGCDVRIATGGAEGLELIRNGGIDLVVTDLVMNDVDGMAITQATKHYWPETEVLVCTGHSSVSTAVEAMQKGAMTYLEKPLNINVLRAQVAKAAEKLSVVRERAELRRQIDKRFGFENIIGQSRTMQQIFDVMGQISPTNATVLIEGESGTGKELVAKAIHNNSPRKARPFVGLNCAALSEGILESELFGHEKGAFTGADQQRLGRFEYADHGTLFLDEVGDMPMTTQIKLLRVIEEREIMRVGSNEPIKVNVRLIAATNANLQDLVREKKFREDLYFRLNVVRISLPPLRARHDDIPLLIDAFMKEVSEENGKPIKGMTPEARGILYRYEWPGNVRELRNCIESMVVTTRGVVLDVIDVPPHIATGPSGGGGVQEIAAGMSIDEAEKILVLRTLEMTRGNREEAARILQIGERTLYRKLDKYGLK
jgi:two-component system, NtrC family, response regulator HydG